MTTIFAVTWKNFNIMDENEVYILEHRMKKYFWASNMNKIQLLVLRLLNLVLVTGEEVALYISLCRQQALETKVHLILDHRCTTKHSNTVQQEKKQSVWTTNETV